MKPSIYQPNGRFIIEFNLYFQNSGTSRSLYSLFTDPITQQARRLHAVNYTFLPLDSHSLPQLIIYIGALAPVQVNSAWNNCCYSFSLIIYYHNFYKMSIVIYNIFENFYVIRLKAQTAAVQLVRIVQMTWLYLISTCKIRCNIV